MKRFAAAFAVSAACSLAATAHANNMTLDFDTDALNGSILAGQVIDDEYAGFGITISAQNNKWNHPDEVIAFDSANPTGGDGDLRTPGYGSNNNTPLGMLLIIAEDIVDNSNDGFVDDPDDEARGGTIFFDFDNAITANGSMIFVDIEEFGGTIELFNNGSLVDSVGIADIGDNSYQSVAFGQNTFDQLRVNLVGSGAVGALTLNSDQRIPEPASLTLLAAGVAMISRRRRKA